MNKTSIGFVVAGLLIASFGFGLLIQHNQNAELSRRLSKLESALFTQSQTALEQSALLQGADAELESMRREAQQRHAAPVPAAPESEALVRSSALALEKAKSEIVPPNVTADRGQKTYVFPQLVNAKSDVVLTNAEFRTLAGRRLTFRVAEGPRAFDVDELHPGVLAYLDIDSGAIKQNYELQKQRERIQQMMNAAAKAQALREWEEHAAKVRVEQEKALVEREKAAAYRAERMKSEEQVMNERRKVIAAERQATAQEDTVWELRKQNINPLLPTNVRIVP